MIEELYPLPRKYSHNPVADVFWAWIAPPLRDAFSESWWHAEYYSKVEKVGSQRLFFEKITGCLLQKTL